MTHRAAVVGLTLLGTLAACSETVGVTGSTSKPSDDGSSTNGTLALRVPVDTVRPGALLRAVVTGVTLAPTVSATLGSAALTLTRESDTTLVAIVPDMAAAVVPLAVSVGTRTGQVSLTVRAGLTIADPAGELTRYTESVTRRYATATIPSGFSADEWTRARFVVDSLDRAFRLALTTATAAERLAAARYLGTQGTALRTAESGHVSTSSVQLVTPDRCNGAKDRLTAQGINVLNNLRGLQASQVLKVNVNNFVDLFEHFDGVYDWIVSMAVLPVECAAAEILEAEPPTVSVVDQGGLMGVGVMATIRYLDGSRSQDPTIASYTRLIDDVVTLARSFPAQLAGALRTLPSRVQDLPVRPTVRALIEAARLRVLSVSPSTVSVTSSAQGTQLTLSPTTTASTATDFTVTLAHVDDASLRTTVRGTVRPGAAPIAVTVSPANITVVGAGKEEILRATATGTTNQSFLWEPRDQRVVTIVGTPIGGAATIRGQDPGVTTVRVTSLADPTKSAVVTVTVTSGIGISITPDKATMSVGQPPLRLTATLTGTNSTGVLWDSNNQNVATVDLLGNVTARAVGTATITAVPALDLNTKATATITVVAASPVSIRASQTAATLVVGQSIPIAITVTGVAAGQDNSVRVTNSAADVAAVVQSATGLVITALSTGTSTIFVRPVADLTKFVELTIAVVPGANPTATRITSGVPVSGIAGTALAERLYVITVPTGATSLTARMSGGAGDADLYVRRGASPLPPNIDCKSETVGNNDSCTVANPAAGEWYVLVRGVTTFSGVSLTATVTGGAGTGGNSCSATWVPILTSTAEWRETPPPGSSASRFGWAFTATQVETRAYYGANDVDRETYAYTVEASKTTTTGCRLSFVAGAVLYDIVGLSGNALTIRSPSNQATRTLTR